MTRAPDRALGSLHLPSNKVTSWDQILPKEGRKQAPRCCLQKATRKTEVAGKGESRAGLAGRPCAPEHSYTPHTHCPEQHSHPWAWVCPGFSWFRHKKSPARPNGRVGGPILRYRSRAEYLQLRPCGPKAYIVTTDPVQKTCQPLPSIHAIAGSTA